MNLPRTLDVPGRFESRFDLHDQEAHEERAQGYTFMCLEKPTFYKKVGFLVFLFVSYPRLQLFAGTCGLK